MDNRHAALSVRRATPALDAHRWAAWRAVDEAADRTCMQTSMLVLRNSRRSKSIDDTGPGTTNPGRVPKAFPDQRLGASPP
jgi:hypothetical protein